MSHQNPASAKSVQYDDGAGYQKLEKPGSECADLSTQKGIFGGAALEIGLASALLILPMLILTAVLLILVLSHQMPDHNSTYSYQDDTQLPLGSAFFVNYSSTTLVYIASLSSTIATILISTAMILFSYVLARMMTQESDNNHAARLPTLFQLQLLIRMVDGRLTALWSHLLYILGGKRRKVPTVPILWKATAMMVALVLLAGLLTLADLWLHLSTKSVLYLELKPTSVPDSFHPGRGVNRTCLAGGDDLIVPAGCLIRGGDAVNTPQLVDSSEYIKTAGNQSDKNRVYLSSYQNNTYATLGPAQTPPDVDFQATSYGSHTECRVVTSECGAISAMGARDEPAFVFNFICNASMAGLNMSGNFAFLGQSGESGQTTGKFYNGSDPAFPPNINNLTQNDFDFGVQYFSDSAKQQQLSAPDSLGLPSGNFSSQYYWALVFSVNVQTDKVDESDNDEKTDNPWGYLNLVAGTQGEAEGILSCVTTISEISYAMTGPNLQIESTRFPTVNASQPFVIGITGGWGDEQLHQGLQQSLVRAENPSDLASLFATVYDQTVVAIPAGVLPSLPPTNATQRVQTQVARVPKAPFACLLLLNLAYAAIGVILTATAVIAVSRGRRVRDAQARLSVAAIVAESFESPSWGEDARSIDNLFAERSGRMTRSVALAEGKNGGRKFRQLVNRYEEESNDS